MKRTRCWAFAGLALCLTACTAQAQPRPASDLRQPTKIDLESACPGSRWLAITKSSSGSCPNATGFRTCRLIDSSCRVQIGITSTTSPRDVKSTDSGLEKQRLEDLHATGLDRFCIYDAVDPEADLTPKLSRNQVTKLDKDCLSAMSLGLNLEGLTWRSFRSQFLDQSGRAGMTLKSGDPKVRMAIVDTQPTSESMPSKRGCSSHGYSLALMAQNLLCGRPGAKPEDCAAQVTTRLALNVKSNNPEVRKAIEPCEGGLVGWIGDLAPALQDEIDTWTRQRNPQRLILNLSLGWDPDYFGGLKETKVEDMSVPVQAVYRALQYASRKEVLVVAAAGNATPGPTTHEGPLLPAAWEGWIAGSGFTKKENKHPLIFAVGGVRWNDTNLPNSRPRATPPRVAYADHAVVSDPLSPKGADTEPTATLTGTSVSSIVVSAAAALTWSEKPSLKPTELMRLVETERGKTTKLTADFGTTPSVAARRICLDGPKSCGGGKAEVSFSPELSTLAAPVFDASTLVGGPPSPPCKAARAFKRPLAPPPSSFCPCDQFESVWLQPWVGTQPGTDPCPSCSGTPRPPLGGALLSLFPPMAGLFSSGERSVPLDQTASVFIEIPDDWWPGNSSLEATTLEITYSNGDLAERTTYSYSLHQTFSKSGQTALQVTGLAAPSYANPVIRSATLNFIVEREGQKMSVSSPLFFSP